MNPFCECPLSGYCQRHQMLKGPELHKRCKGLAGTRDCGRALWLRWEQGGAGATAPTNPVLNVESFCKSVGELSTVGTHLAEIIKRESGQELDCQACLARVFELNSMPAELAPTVKTSIVDEIVQRVAKLATGMNRAGAWLDRVVTGGAVTRQLVEGWFDEAVKLAELDAEAPKKKGQASNNVSDVLAEQSGQEAAAAG